MAVLKADERAIFTAASKAAEATAYLHNDGTGIA
jgi:antirestriction protein ArdC